MRTSIKQDREFIDDVMQFLRNDGLLEHAIQWIAQNLSPEDVFSDGDLQVWAQKLGGRTVRISWAVEEYGPPWRLIDDLEDESAARKLYEAEKMRRRLTRLVKITRKMIKQRGAVEAECSGSAAAKLEDVT